MNTLDKIPGFITVRTGSSRLPKKCLLPFGEGNVLEHIIDRARHFDFLPVVCTTDLPEDNVIEDIADHEHCLLHRGDVKDKLSNWLGACDKFNIDAFHTIDADDLFFDGELGRERFSLLNEYDFVYPEGYYVGACGYSIKTEALRRAYEVEGRVDTIMMWHVFEGIPEVKKSPNPDWHYHIRLTLDYEEDYWLLRTVLRMLGKYATKDDIVRFFTKENHYLNEVNWHRNAEWKSNQEAHK